MQDIGIQKIEGKIIGDATRWEKALAPSNWSWEDMGNYYGAGACALSFNENQYSISLKPGQQMGDSVSILSTDPPISMICFHNEVKTGPEKSGDRTCIYGSEFSLLQFLRGTIPIDCNNYAIKGSIPDPATYCSFLLEKKLENRGIVSENKETCYGKRVGIHITYSPTVAEIVRWTNQKSINLFAEHLLKKSGEKSYITMDQHLRVFWRSKNFGNHKA